MSLPSVGLRGFRRPDPAAPWHCLDVDAVLTRLQTSARGLEPPEAEARLREVGPNTLTEGRGRPPLGLLASQFADAMILVLAAAAAISALVGDVTDALVIVAIVILNGGLGFVQEYRAERAMAALRVLAAPTADVVRGGRVRRVPADALVPGDVVRLSAGAVVPADIRLLEAAALRVDEAALTGESTPVAKTTAALEDGALPVADRTNMAYRGTVVTYGRGSGVVVATGMATEFGRIAGLLQETRRVPTPLQRRLASFGRVLAVAAAVVGAVVFVGGALRGEDPWLVFLTAVSLAVAAVPEALPAVVTITLALGARGMVQRRVLVRRLAAVETLGSVTYICADKTGTLTQNRMQVEAMYCDGVLARAPGRNGPWEELLRAMAVSNDADLDEGGRAVGDPTEVALRLAAEQAGLRKTEVERALPRAGEVPFDAERKRMTTVHALADGGAVSYTKGAVEAVLDLSTHVLTAAGPVPVSRQAIVEVSDRMSADGLRVLAFAMRRWSAPPGATADRVERDLVLLGLVGLADPPRPEAVEAVAVCRGAGIVPVMITGDHPLTARAVARRLGIVEGHDAAVMTGRELARLSAGELEDRVAGVRVYARVAPEQKLGIVRALQARGEVVAMTGDGVNDAPALRQADVGVAMGVTGTDVSKEASAMVLLDDSFASIVEAVREGRRIYDNLRRFVRYALTTNSGEAWTVFLAPFLGLPLPLLPVHILWMNLLTDGLPGLALAAEPAERDVMRRPPRPPKQSIFADGLAAHVVWVGALMAGLALSTEALYVGAESRQTMVFAVLSFAQLAHVLAIRSERESVAGLGLLSNVPLAGAVALTVGLQLAVIYVPFANGLLHTVPLSAPELAVAVGASSIIFVVVEAEKAIRRRRGRRRIGEAGTGA